MKVLVTGAQGFVGRHLMRELLKKHQVTVASRKILDEQSSASAIKFDLFEAERFICPPDIDVVIHLAGIAHGKLRSDISETEQFSVGNVDATRTLAKACRKAGVRHFIFISSVGVHGAKTDNAPLTEDSPFQPHTAYTQSKLDAELAVKDICAGSEMCYTIIRPPLVYAADAPGNFNTLLKIAATGLPLPFKNVNNSRNMISVTNLSWFINACIDREQSYNEDYLVADGSAVSLKNILTFVRKGMGNKVLIYPFPPRVLTWLLVRLGKVAMAQQLFCNLEIDNGKARNIVGAFPVSAESALKEAGEYFKKNSS